MGHHPRVVELHLFVPDRDGTHLSFLQEDDGLTFAERDGARVRTTFEVERRSGRVTVRAEVDGSGYPEFAREAFHLVVHGAAPEVVRVDGAEVRAVDVVFALPNTGEPFTVDFDL
jgi:alpha-glucosidase